jgi:hypothetical protein
MKAERLCIKTIDCLCVCAHCRSARRFFYARTSVVGVGGARFLLK